MKIIIDHCEIEIKAKKIGESKYNKQETMYILNMFSLYAHEAAQRYRKDRLNGIARQAEEVSEMIYDVLDTNRFYD